MSCAQKRPVVSGGVSVADSRTFEPMAIIDSGMGDIELERVLVKPATWQLRQGRRKIVLDAKQATELGSALLVAGKSEAFRL